MEYINLGKSELKVSRLGFGCCPMGGHGWGKVSEDDFKNAVSGALDVGINFFDTADIYGFGRSEELLGKFLKERREEAVIATKFGLRTDDKGKTFYDNSPAWIEKALNGSLSRLGVGYIDLYQAHYLDGKTPIADVISILEKKKKEGKIRYYGLSNVSMKDIDDIIMPDALVSFQGEYSLAKREREKEIKSLIAEKGLSFISWGSLGQGVLTGKYRPGMGFGADDRRARAEYVNFHGEKFAKNADMVESIRKYFKEHGKTISQIAVRWILDRFENSVALVGVKNPLQVEENSGASGWKLSEKEIAYLDMLSR